MANRKIVSAASPDVRAQNVILEDIRSQIHVVIEGMQSGFAGVHLAMADLETRLSKRITILEEVVRQNSVDIRKNSEDIRKSSEDIARLSSDVAKLKVEVSRLRDDFERVGSRKDLEALERRVTALETRLGLGS